MRRVKAAERPPRWRLTAAILGIVVVFVAVLSIYRLYTLRTWDGSSRFTVVRYKTADTKSFEIVSFDPVTSEGITLTIPNTLEIATIGGRGTWRAGVLPELAKRFGWTWAADSLADSLGLASVGFEPALGTWDKLAWWWYTRQMSFRSVDLSETALLEKSDAVDGQKVLGLSTTWDDKAREWFVSAHLVAEGQTIRIINSLGEPGMGTHAARIIEHSGLRVGQIDNDSATPVEQCEVTAGEQSDTAKFLERYFGCTLGIVAHQSDVVLKLGYGYKAKWLGAR